MGKVLSSHVVVCMHADTTKEQTFTGKWMPYKKTDVKIFYSSFLYNYHLGT